MGTTQSIYIGHYMRVWLPEEKYFVTHHRCLKCRRVIPHAPPFCSECGGEVVEESTTELLPMDPWGLNDIWEDTFNNIDRFSWEESETNKWVMVLNNCPSPDHKFLAEEYETAEITIPGGAACDDWEKLAQAFDDTGIKYETRFGIVSYWS